MLLAAWWGGAVESLMFLIDTFAIVYLVVFSLKNDKLRDGARQLGFFRLREEAPVVADRSAGGHRAGRGRRL